MAIRFGHGRSTQKRTRLGEPALVVVPFQGLSDGEGSELLASGLTHGLIMGLTRFDGLQVFAARAGGLATWRCRGGDDSAAYVVTGSVERGPEPAAGHRDPDRSSSSQVFWSEGYDDPSDRHGVLD